MIIIRFVSTCCLGVTIIARALAGVASFTSITTRVKSNPKITSFLAASDWISLTEDHAVQKRIIGEGSGTRQAQNGDKVDIDYVGTIGKIDWDVESTIQCWLLSQQGLDGLADGFRDAKIDAAKLMDTSMFFTEEFVAQTLEVSNKIQIKKIVMAAKRLASVVEEYRSGTKFDSNKDRGDEPYSFILGNKKTIRAMELAVASMREGERADMRCRADYAYGSEGLRKRNGEVMVPPFATLCFDITLLKCSS